MAFPYFDKFFFLEQFVHQTFLAAEQTIADRFLQDMSGAAPRQAWGGVAGFCYAFAVLKIEKPVNQSISRLLSYPEPGSKILDYLKFP